MLPLKNNIIQITQYNINLKVNWRIFPEESGEMRQSSSPPTNEGCGALNYFFLVVRFRVFDG